MASSGSVNWTATRNQIIRAALLDLRAVGRGETISSEDMSDAVFALNGMVKAFAADGLKVWTVREATLFPQAEQVKYGVGTSATDHVTETYHQTAITSDEAAGQTILSVDSTTNMTAADNIGIVLDSGTIQWTTVSSKTATTVTIATALTDSAAADSEVFTYTNKITRPLRIVDARRYNIAGLTDTPIIVTSREEYQALPLKTGTGNINQIFYDRVLSTAYIYLWQPLDAVTDLVKFTWHRPIEDFDAAGDNPDLPVEWIMALRYNLAESLLAQYPVSDSVANRISGLAQKYLSMVMGDAGEIEPVYIVPDRQY